MTQEQFILQLEIVADPDSPASPAILGEIERYMIEELSKENYNVKPVYTGHRGGGALFEILKLVEQGTTLVWQHLKEIEEFAQGVSSILTLFKTVQKIIEKQSTSTTLKITLSSKKSGITTVIEGTDYDVVVKAVKDLEEKDPGIIASGQTKLTAQIQQPPKRHRR